MRCAYRAYRWYRRHATPWAQLRDDLWRGIRHLPVILAPIPFAFGTVRRSARHWDDETVQLRARDCGLSGARLWSAMLFWLALASARTGLISTAVLLPVCLWAVLSLIVALVPIWTSLRFAHVNSGRMPGEDPASRLARLKAAAYWRRAVCDARFAATAPPVPVSPAEAAERERIGMRAAP